VAAPGIDCMGYELCSALKGAKALMPPELLAGQYACTAFPSPALMHRLWVVLMMVSVLLPISMFYGEGMKLCHSKYATAPIYLSVVRLSTKQKAASRGHGAILQSCFFGLYGLFFNMDKLNKAIASCFIACFNFIFRTPKCVTKGIKAIRNSILGAIACVKEKLFPSSTGPPSAVQIKPASILDNPIRQGMYSVLALAWFIAVWFCMTNAVQIRAAEGKQAEEDMLTAWGESLAVEQFGKEGVKLVFLKTFVAWLTGKLEAIFLREDMLNKWHDGHLFKTIINSQEMDDVDLDEDEEIPEDDEQDMDMDVDM